MSRGINLIRILSGQEGWSLRVAAAAAAVAAADAEAARD